MGNLQPQGFICFQRNGIFIGGVKNLHLGQLGHIMPAGFFTIGDEILQSFCGLGVKGRNIWEKGDAIGTIFRFNGFVCPEGSANGLQSPSLLCHMIQMGSDAFTVVKSKDFQSTFSFHRKDLLLGGGFQRDSGSRIDAACSSSLWLMPQSGRSTTMRLSL